jgi:hypothetical protein
LRDETKAKKALHHSIIKAARARGDEDQLEESEEEKEYNFIGTPDPTYREGDLVTNIPRTSSARPNKAERETWRVTGVDLSKNGLYEVSMCSVHNRQSTRVLFEHEIQMADRSLDDGLGGTCDTQKKRKLTSELNQISGLKCKKLKDKIVSQQASYMEVLAENKTLKYQNTRLSKKNEELKSSNKVLSEDCHWVRSANLFVNIADKHFGSDETRLIRSQHLKVVGPLNDELSAMQKRCEKLELAVSEQMDKLKEYAAKVKERGLAMRDLSKLSKALTKSNEELNSDLQKLEHKSKEDEVALRIERDLGAINTLLHGTSVRKCVLIERDDDKGKSYYNKLRQKILIMQMLLNGKKLADAVYYRHMGHDESGLEKYTTMAVNVIVEYSDGTSEKICLTASTLVRDKGAAAGVDCVKELFEFTRDIYKRFSEENADICSSWPHFSEISLVKMRDFCVVMSDNANAAKATSNGIIDLVRDLVEEEFTQEELDALSPEERTKLVNNIQFGCLPHIRCLFGGEAIKDETEWMKERLPVADQHKRLETAVSSVLFAIQKLFRDGKDQYAKGEQAAFIAWTELFSPHYVKLNLGRHGTGSRMDAQHEVAYKICLNRTTFLKYLLYDDAVSSKHDKSILSESVLLRIATEEFKCAMIVRAMLWRSLFAPLRVLCNVHDLVGHGIHHAGRVMDVVERFCKELQDDPSKLMSIDAMAFSFDEFSCLKPYFDSLEKKLKSSVGGVNFSLRALEKREIYEAYTEEESDLIKELIVVSVGGILKSLYRNCPKLLTSMGGVLSFSMWSDDDISKSKHNPSDNIVAESSFGLVDYIWRRGVNFNMATVDGLAIAQTNKFFSNAPRGWTEEHSRRSLVFSTIYFYEFRDRSKGKLAAQEAATKLRVLEKNENLEKMMNDQQSETLSYFYMWTTREITTKQKLISALSTLSVGESVSFLKNFINTYVIGFGLMDLKGGAFSNVKDKSVGKVPDLTKRALNILDLLKRKKLKIPENPESPKLNMCNPADYGFKETKEFKEFKSVYENRLIQCVEDRRILDEAFSLRLTQHHGGISRSLWEAPLTILQKKFKRGEQFKEDGKCWVSAGLLYDSFIKDYYLFYYPKGAAVESTSDDRVERTPFCSCVDEQGNEVEGINQWSTLTFSVVK